MVNKIIPFYSCAQDEYLTSMDISTREEMTMYFKARVKNESFD